MFEIVKANTRAAPGAVWNRYPWRVLEIDQAFVVPARVAKENALRVGASCAGKRLARTFHVTKFANGDFEVWRSK